MSNSQTQSVSEQANTFYDHNQTPLHAAAYRKHEEASILLMDMTRISSLLKDDSFGKNVWDYAQENNMENLKEALFTKFKNLQQKGFTRDMIDDYVTMYRACTTGGPEDIIQKICDKYPEVAVTWGYGY